MDDKMNAGVGSSIGRHMEAARAVKEIFDYLEDFFIYAEAFALQLTPVQKLVFDRFRDHSKTFRHDMAVASNPNSERPTASMAAGK